MTARTTSATSRHPASAGAGCSRLCAGILAACLVLPGAAHADRPPLGTVEAGPGVAWLDYAEYRPDGGVLDRESGLVPGATVAVELLPSRWFARLAACAGSGRLRYEGVTQASDPAFDHLPVESTSRARVLGVELQAGAFLDAERRIALYAGGARRRWGRDIEPTTVFSASGSAAQVPELHEEYSWLELEGGVRGVFLRTGRAAWLLDARALRVVRGRVVVARTAGDATLHLGDRTGGRVGLEVRLAVAPRWDVVLEGHGALWRFGESPVDAASLLYEPESESRTAGLEARVAATF